MVRANLTWDTFLALLTGITAGMIASSILSGKKRDNEQSKKAAPRRFGAVIRLKAEKYRRYRELHDAVWEGVLERMRLSNMRNFTIYYHKESGLLFQHFEWVGHWTTKKGGQLSAKEEAELFQADMDRIAQDEVTRKWWEECEPCQEPLTPVSRPPSAGGAEPWWTALECVNHCGHWPTEFSAIQRDPDFAKLE